VLTGLCTDMTIHTGATWQEGLGSALNFIPGLREAAGAGKAVQIAGWTVAALAVVGIVVLLMRAKK